MVDDLALSPRAVTGLMIAACLVAGAIFERLSMTPPTASAFHSFAAASPRLTLFPSRRQPDPPLRRRGLRGADARAWRRDQSGPPPTIRVMPRCP